MTTLEVRPVLVLGTAATFGAGRALPPA